MTRSTTGSDPYAEETPRGHRPDVRRGEADAAHYWRHPGLPGIDLLRARYRRQRFDRHSHEGYVFGFLEDGVEEFEHAGSTERVGRGGLALLNPEVVHTGYAGVPDGWSYRVVYPERSLVEDVAAELGGGTPYFPEPVVDCRACRERLAEAHRAAERADALVASSLMRDAFATIVRHHATRLPGADQVSVSPGESRPLAVVGRAREVLHERMAEPPRLEALAAEVGSGPFALTRAFHRSVGLPPYAYLNQQRLRRARRLLDAGTSPGDVAQAVGFTDQAHLTRLFKRTFGVPPGAYQRGRNHVQDGAAGAA